MLRNMGRLAFVTLLLSSAIMPLIAFMHGSMLVPVIGLLTLVLATVLIMVNYQSWKGWAALVSSMMSYGPVVVNAALY
ncbi:MAG: hypothetical protein JKY49_00905 [Cohaesibacteraceae bacterium]|nr:hypothetical protein [Cohaesibacteraceae bacterium]